MQKINIEEILRGTIKSGKLRLTKFDSILLSVLKKILYIDKINSILEENSHLDIIHFINELFEQLNFSYLIPRNELERIPSEGKIICIANHPIGSLDGLILLKIFLEIRNDVKIIANDILYHFDFIKPYLLPIDIFSEKKLKRDYLIAISESLKNESAIIMFPAASVSRLNWFRVTDSKWHKSAVSLARKHQAPLLPVYIEARNSLLFYLVSLINRKASTLLLAHELFNKKNKLIRIKIGNQIPSKAFTLSYVNDIYQTTLLRKHVYLMGQKNKFVFKTENTIIHPVDRRFIKKELNGCKFLGVSNEDIYIYSVTKKNAPFSINEIARLREKTFRDVGEGTGKKLDLDKFDMHYHHIIMWDNKELEIVGAYRLGIGKNIIEEHGVNGFYTSTLFNFTSKFQSEYLINSIELGRSFIQKKYWNTNALNYLWQGIGAFLSTSSEIRYLFGCVSISDAYPEYAKKLIVYYYKKWFSSNQKLIESKNRFLVDLETENEFSQIFKGENAKLDYVILKNLLRQMNCSVPVLYKHYSDLCDEGGVVFADFGVDVRFANCIDGLIIVDLHKIKEVKKNKFIKKINEGFKIPA